VVTRLETFIRRPHGLSKRSDEARLPETSLANHQDELAHAFLRLLPPIFE
jgi:hypothetical protein